MGGGSSKNVNKQNQVEEAPEHIEKASKVVAGKEEIIAVKADDNSSSEMLVEAQKALEQMDSLTDEHIKSISSLNNEIGWETQLEADQNMSTKEYDASLLIQTFLRQVSARKHLTRKVNWKNMNQLELFFERHATKHSRFYEKIYSTRIENSTLSTDQTTQKPSYFSFPKVDTKNYTHDYCESSVAQTLEKFRQNIEACLKLEDIEEILENYISMIKDEKTIVTVPEQNTSVPLCVVVGDIHGHFEDLMEIIDHNGVPSKNKPYIFTGNVINYGPKSLHCLIMILLWSLADPGSVYFLRGNHEHTSFSLKFGFVHQLTEMYGFTDTNQSALHGVFILLRKMFRNLPLCVQLYETCLICHAGVWRDENVSLEYVKEIQRSQELNVGNRFLNLFQSAQNIDLMKMTEENRKHAIVQDILWSDLYHSTFTGLSSSSISFNETRGISVMYDVSHVQRFLKRNKLDRLVIAGLPLQHGYVNKCKLVTRVFSASSFYGRNSNSGGYILIEEKNLEVHPCSFSVDGRGKRDNHYNYLLCLSNAVREHLLDLEKGFKKIDYTSKGVISVLEWASVMEEETGLRIPWLIDRSDILHWEEIDLESSNVNYQKFLFNRGLTEETEKRRKAQAFLLKYSRPIYFYFEGSKKLLDTITVEEFSDAANLLLETSNCSELKNDVIVTMYDILGSSLYCQPENFEEKGVQFCIIKSLATGEHYTNGNQGASRHVDTYTPKKKAVPRTPELV
eukprot:g7630.t1